MEKDKFEKISKIAVSYYNQRESLLMFVSTVDDFSLRKSAIDIANKCNKSNPLPIYVVQGSVRGEHGWPFFKLRKIPRLQLLQNGTMVTDTSGLILPQDVPIVLLAEEFDQFDERDQLAYSHLVDTNESALRLNLCAGSILIAGIGNSQKGKLDISVANRGMHIDMEEIE
jgi:hypothetical protein